ncbi:rRNA biogenesis protein RRP36-like [Dendronephthya gigantea]|uniref:rRNA biogenesis protein RRP36-like n=1 Tax=Dendronephthya gigantea TaxID=151771 RepID=UPI00106CFE96|nr:rRNA biogenesis protein RRP36-like [Dendronephthya gigantea]
MNKLVVIFFLGVITIVFAESSLKRDKDTLIKALKEKFNQYKKEKLSESKKTDDLPPPAPATSEQKQHDKAAGAIGLALLDVSAKPKAKEEKKTDKTTENNEDDDEMPEDNNVDSINVELSNKKQDKSELKPKQDDKGKLVAGDSKETENKKKEQEDIKDEDEGNKDESNDRKESEKEDEAEDEDEGKDGDDGADVDTDKESETSKDSGKDTRKKVKNTAEEIKETAKQLKDKDLKAVNVGQLKKLLQTSVENLDKAGRAIQNLLQYDQRKRLHSRNRQGTPQPYRGYPQQGYGGYPQQQPSPYQATGQCSGQCSNLCAPACRDPCCRFPPSLGGYNSPPVQARGSYQQGLVNAYPPNTQLGGGQANYQPQMQVGGQQCGAQCSAQSCAPSCSPSCCAQRGQIVPPGQANAGCPMSCLSNCSAACHARCCVPGKKK